MNLSISGRHMDVTDAMKSHMESGLDKVLHHFDRVTHADVVLSVEKHRHIAEIKLHVNGGHLQSKESSADMYASMDAALAKVDKQIKKYKDRIQRHHPRTAREARSYGHQIIEAGIPRPADLEPEYDHVAHEVVLHEKLPADPFTVADAMVTLAGSQDPFIAFVNAETDQINVLYARDDGTFGLIEP